MPRYLAVVERAYRGAIEEQYGHVLWLAHSLRKMRGEISVFLRANAVLYALAEQPLLSLTIGDLHVAHLPHYETTIKGLLADGAAVYVSAADMRGLQVEPSDLCSGVEIIDDAGLVRLFASYDAVWYW